ncbi:MAG: M16 family metallopeptidase, partial [Candidatus Neomarinimicrobiota bacterium]
AFHEDNFAKSPELNMVFPTVQEGHKDAYALDILADLLTDGKKAPLYKVIVEEKKLAPSISGYQESMEITGAFHFRIRTFPDISLTDVEKAIQEAFERFETEGFTDRDLARIKAQTETVFYNSIASILGKAFQLARYNEYFGSPDFLVEYIQNYLAVTKEDVMRVYNTYLKGKPYVLTSFVPKGQAELVAGGSERFPVVEDVIMAEAPAEKPAATPAAEAMIEKTPSSIDRAVKPPFGPQPLLSLPTVWRHELNNGIRIFGIQHDELPLVQFSLVLKGGQLLDLPDKVGVANMITDIMMEGTQTKTPLELEEAIDELGSRVDMYTGRESITVRANTLTRNFERTYALVEEILLEPRWDAKEYARIKDQTLEDIHRAGADPQSIATNTFNRLVYGEDHILGHPLIGHTETVEAITIEDLKAYYQANFSPALVHIVVVGNVTRDQALATFQSLEEKWPLKEVIFPEQPEPPAIKKSTVYFVDVPGAKQSQLRVGYLGLPYTDPDYYPAEVMNYKLGGAFNARLNMILREEKGYTYGARSGFAGGHYPGTFAASTSVHTAATLESMTIIRDEMAKYTQGIPPEDLQFTKDALIKSNARSFETLGALMGMLDDMARYGLPDDYIKDREQVVQELTLERHRQLARQYLPADRMVYLVVGDAKTQLEPLKDLGFGKPNLIEQE